MIDSNKIGFDASEMNEFNTDGLIAEYSIGESQWSFLQVNTFVWYYVFPRSYWTIILALDIYKDYENNIHLGWHPIPRITEMASMALMITTETCDKFGLIFHLNMLLAILPTISLFIRDSDHY